MALNIRMVTGVLALVFVIVIVIGAGATQAFAADELSAEDMVRSLKAAPAPRLTRGLGPAKVDKERLKSRGLVIEISKKEVKQQTHEDRVELVKIVEKYKLPTIDLTIYFNYNSAKIRPDSIRTLIKLGRALTNKELKEGTFLVGGHTDARGGNDYNLDLSQARAISVKTFLIQNFGIGQRSLVAVGFGEEELKDEHEPESGLNRRVQVTNLTH